MKMMRRYLVVVALMMLWTVSARSEGRPLEFVKEIGVGCPIDSGYWMRFAAFNADGTMVASDGPASPDDGEDNLTLWSFPEGRLVRHLRLSLGDLSPNWKYVETSQGVVELLSGKTILGFKESEAPLITFSLDGRDIAESPPDEYRSNGGSRPSGIRIYDLANGEEVNHFGKRQPFSMAISPDGQTLAAGYWDIVTLWNLGSGERLGVLRGFGRYVIGLSFSRDGRLLAGGTDSGTLQIWNVDSKTRLQVVDLGGGDVSVPAFSPDGHMVAVGVYGWGRVFLMDVSSGRILDWQKVSSLGCGSVAFSPDGKYLITPSTGGLIKWPYDHGGTIRVFKVNAP